MNKVVTAGATGSVIFFTGGLTDVITIASGANISAGNAVVDLTTGSAVGVINLGANITALNDTGAFGTLGQGIDLASSINLTAAVSMKAAGTAGNIN